VARAFGRRDGSGRGWRGSVEGGGVFLQVSGDVREDEKNTNEACQKTCLVSVTHRASLPSLGSPLCSVSIAFSSIGPTSLRRGEGHRVALSSIVESKMGSEMGSEVVMMVVVE
jgi:hypothetical protein